MVLWPSHPSQALSLCKLTDMDVEEACGECSLPLSPGLELAGAALEVSAQTLHGSSASSASFLANVGEKIPNRAGSPADGNTAGDSSVATPLLWCPSGPHWNLGPQYTCTLRASTATLHTDAEAWLNTLQIAPWEHYLGQFSKANCPGIWERCQDLGLSPR